MGRETVEVHDGRRGSVPARGADAPPEPEALAARLKSVQHAYEQLLERVRGYERERCEIRSRLERLIARMGRL